jgi:hypothetical protein
MSAERETRREVARHAFDQLQYEVMHNLVVETTRLSIEVKNLRMRVESITGRLEFNERRARALEAVVVYKPSDETPRQQEPRPALRAGAEPLPPPVEGAAPAPPAAGIAPAPGAAPGGEGPGQRSRRRRRRRGRRSGGAASAVMGTSSGSAAPPGAPGASQEASTPLADPDDEGDALDTSDAAIEELAHPERQEPTSGAPAPAAEGEPSVPTPSRPDAGAATSSGPDDPQ